jgi:glycosyltransferase involved in cell wall biosynthesis
VLEAFALERPVVAASVGGIPEIVIDGETGILTPAGDPDCLAAAVLRLLNDRDFARKVAAAGRRLVAERYSPDAQASAMAALYREALACA